MLFSEKLSANKSFELKIQKKNLFYYVIKKTFLNLQNQNNLQNEFYSNHYDVYDDVEAFRRGQLLIRFKILKYSNENLCKHRGFFICRKIPKI